MSDGEFGKPVILAVGDVLMADDREKLLRDAGLAVDHVADGASALAFAQKQVPQVWLVGEKLPDMDGVALLRALRERNLPHTALIALKNEGEASASRVRGAYDFLIEPVSRLKLVTALRNARERAMLHAAVEDLSPDMGPAGYFGFIGRSVAMRSVYRMMESVAGSRATVFITGERGTGKVVCANAIHKAGPRSDAPFVCVDCTSVPKDKLDAAIFGYLPELDIETEFGAGGAIARANGGTLFIREICALDPELQEKILRFLQTGRHVPFGTVNDARFLDDDVDVRVICDTDRDPMQEVMSGRFRQDLFYRLHVLPIHLPALREREGDAVEIAARTLREEAAEAGKHFRNLTPEARAAIAAYDWPGNVRELHSVIHEAVGTHDGEFLSLDMLPAFINSAVRSEDPESPRDAANAKVAEAAQGQEAQSAEEGGREEDEAGALTVDIGITLADMERNFIEATIDACDGSLPRAAKILGVSPSTLYRKRDTWMSGR
ncbi:sigma-54 dependent transcriptional regulator [Breoghania sp.]|uniref:sigma-54-dependent transcriptional regulator n=1 Tax=Breoghania sp. TaxID=2065378 RepID=UPI002AA727E4|nr:sigma-54 dependent transcriptional regulator [Breoghania sp.]